MAFPSLTFRAELDPVTRKELELFFGQLEGFLRSAGFKDDGSFTNLVADSLTVNNVSVAGNVVTGGFLHMVERTLYHDEITALPTTQIQLLKGPGPGKFLRPVFATFIGQTLGGGYTTSAVYAEISIKIGDLTGTQEYGLYGLTNDNTTSPAIALLSTLIGGTGNKIYLAAFSNAAGWDYSSGIDYVQNNVINSVAVLEDQPMLIFADNSGGNFSGGHAVNTLTVRVFYTIEDIPTAQLPPPITGCSSDLWSDDFESGAALSADYDTVSHLTKTAGIGSGGSKGIEGTGTTSQKYLGELRKILTVNSRLGCFTADIKPSASLHSGAGGTGFYYMEVHDDNDGFVLGVYSGGSYAGTMFGDLSVYDDFSTSLEDISGAFADGVNKSLNVEWQLSSISGAARQPDGWVKVRVNGTLVSSLSGLVIGNYNAITNPNNYWGRIRFAPQGVGDNLVVRK